MKILNLTTQEKWKKKGLIVTYFTRVLFYHWCAVCKYYHMPILSVCAVFAQVDSGLVVALSSHEEIQIQQNKHLSPVNKDLQEKGVRQQTHMQCKFWLKVPRLDINRFSLPSTASLPKLSLQQINRTFISKTVDAKITPPIHNVIGEQPVFVLFFPTLNTIISTGAWSVDVECDDRSFYCNSSKHICWFWVCPL